MTDHDFRVFFRRCLAAVLLALLIRWLVAGAEPANLSAASPERLIDLLGDDDSDTRENAAAELSRRGWWEVGQLVRFHLEHPDAEIRASCRRIHVTIRERALQQFAPFPQCDALWLDLNTKHYERDTPAGHRYGPYLDRAKWEDDTTGESWGHYRAGMKYIVREWMEEGRSESAIRAELCRLHCCDLVWILHAAPNMPGAGVVWWQRLAIHPATMPPAEDAP